MTHSKPLASGYDEVEIKQLFANEDAANRFLAALGAPVREEKQQTNYVFDTGGNNRLKRSHMSLRLRIEGAVAYLTLRGPGRTVGASATTRAMAEAFLATADVDDLLNGAIDPLCILRRYVLDDSYQELWVAIDEARERRPLEMIGSFANLRWVVAVVLPWGTAVEVEIDRTHFPNGRIDSEIEIEVPNESLVAAVEQWLEARARELGIALRKATSKIDRFYETLV